MENRNHLKSHYETMDRFAYEEEQRKHMIQPESNFLRYIDYLSKQTVIKDYDIFIDSRDRNRVLYPNPNNYKIELPTTFKHVLSIELISAILPQSRLLINSYNNKLYFQETNAQVVADEYYTATIAQGDYTISELISAIETALNAAGDSGYTVTLVDNDNYVKITSDGVGGDNIFNILWEQNYYGYPYYSIWKLVGFERDSTSTGALTYTAPNRYWIKDTQNLHMILNKFSSYERIVENQTGDTNFGYSTDGIFYTVKMNDDIVRGQYFYWVAPMKPFDVIHQQQEDFLNFKKQNQFDIKQYFFKQHISGSRKIFDKPLSRLSDLTIEWKDDDFYDYDFDGKDHSFHLRIRTVQE